MLGALLNIGKISVNGYTTLKEKKMRTIYATMTFIACFLATMAFIGCFRNTVSAAESEVKRIQIAPNAPTYLYGTRASVQEANVKEQPGAYLRWLGSGELTWSIHVATAGEYEVSLCHAAAADATGQQVDISSGDSKITYALTTKGAHGEELIAHDWLVLFGLMIPLNGVLDLAKGNQTVSLRVSNAAPDKSVMDFRCVTLQPVNARKSIEAEREKARLSRADTEWLVKAGYGLMFHWTSQSIGKDGTRKPFAQAVVDFDLNAFVKMVEEAGAGYVLFTVGHAEPYCPAPIKSWEKYHPGKTTSRDLIEEMADALNAKGIKLMCYFPTHVVGKLRQSTEQEFIQICEEVYTEFGNRYGKKVVGYWFDGFYQCFEQYPGFPFSDFFNVCKAGNPDRVIALNSWIYPPVTEWQEYWAGEAGNPTRMPVDGTKQRGSGRGLRYHALRIMEPYWVQQTVEMPEPRFNSSQLSQYIRNCMENGGAVTINLGIYQDGTVGDKALQVMREVKNIIRNER